MYVSLHSLWVMANRPKHHPVLHGGKLQGTFGLTDPILGTTTSDLQGDTLFLVICRDSENK